MPAHGELHGTQVQPRELAELAYNAGVKDANTLSLMVMICLAESQGFEEAFNDNLDSTGKVTSRDCGLWQINIPASQIGTQTEMALYDRINNAAAMFAKYNSQGYKAWVAYNTGTCYHDTYLQRGCLGVMNYLAANRVAEAKAKGTYQNTPIPIFSIKQLPYYGK